jgi:hypothetical protein
MARDPSGVTALGAARLAQSGSELLSEGSGAGAETQRLSERLEQLPVEDLEALLGILDRAGISPDEI